MKNKGISLQTVNEYRRITNIPENIDELTTPELGALSKAWIERKSDLENSGEYREFIKRLQREWAIETGIIERLYNWERGVTEVLIEQGIESAVIASRGGLHRDEAERAKSLIEDQLSIVEALFAFVKDEQPLTEHFIRSMHAQFTTNQDYVDGLTPDGRPTRVPLLRGKYKKGTNNPRRPNGEIHLYCPPEIVQEEMERLVNWYEQAPPDTPTEILSAWLHHRFTQIHPFQDGNGRVARAIASLVFLKAGLFPLVIRDSDRKEYIEALEFADVDEMGPLVNLFVRRQRDAILKAIGLEQLVQQAGYEGEIIGSILQLLRDKSEARTQQLLEVHDIADRLLEVTVHQLTNLQSRLQSQLAEIQPKYTAWVDHAKNDDERNYYYYNQIVETAKLFDYYANLERYKSWCSLKMNAEGTFEIVISLHSYGQSFNGIMVASAFAAQRVKLEHGRTEPVNTGPVMTDLFQFNYAEPLESTERRFNDWLKSVIAIALEQWRRTLLP